MHRLAQVLVVSLAVASGSAAALAQAEPSAPPSAAPSPAETPTPGAVPTESASPQAQPTPTAAPTFAPAHPIVLDRTRAEIVPGTTLAVTATGGAGPLTARAPADGIVDARYDAVARRIYLTGRAPGTATVTVSDAAGDTASLDVLVAPPAGTVPRETTLELGGTVSSQFATSRIAAEIARAAQLQPGATIDVHGVSLPAQMRAGDSLDVQAHVRIDGHNTFVDQDGATSVHLRIETLAQLDPAFVFYSDDPERLSAAADGVLYRNTIDPSRSARIYAYHVADSSGRRLYLTLRANAPARVQLLGYAAGPTDAFAYAGHVSTLQYLLERSTQESTIAQVTNDAPFVLQLGTRAMNAGELVAAIFDVRVIDGGATDVAIVAASGDADPIDLLDGAELPGDGHGRRGEFALDTVPPLALTFAIGGAEPAPFAIGAPTIANLRPGGHALGGDYGVLRPVALAVSNPTAQQQTAYFYESAAGGTATTTLWFTGDPAPTQIPCVKIPGNRYLVRAIPLAAGESQTVTGEYMTDGTSSFPLLFGLTATAPSPPPGPYAPDACNPKPLPSGSPQPSSSPVASPETSASQQPSPSASPAAIPVATPS